jgi:hypothetical protein
MCFLDYLVSANWITILTDVYFHRLKINHDSHEFILESGTIANTKVCITYCICTSSQTQWKYDSWGLMGFDTTAGCGSDVKYFLESDTPQNQIPWGLMPHQKFYGIAELPQKVSRVCHRHWKTIILKKFCLNKQCYSIPKQFSWYTYIQNLVQQLITTVFVQLKWYKLWYSKLDCSTIVSHKCSLLLGIPCKQSIQAEWRSMEEILVGLQIGKLSQGGMRGMLL